MADNFAILDKDGNAVTIGAKDKTTYKNSKHYVEDGDNVALGATADTAATSDTGTFSLIALFKRLLQSITAGLPSVLTAKTSGGLTIHSAVSGASTNATSVKGSAGQLYNLIATNNGTGVAYLKIYDKATAPTVGTDTPAIRIMLPAGGGARLPDNFGLPMASGLAYGITAGAADNDTTAVSAAQVLVNLFYK